MSSNAAKIPKRRRDETDLGGTAKKGRQGQSPSRKSSSTSSTTPKSKSKGAAPPHVAGRSLAPNANVESDVGEDEDSDSSNVQGSPTPVKISHKTSKVNRKQMKRRGAV